MGTRITDARIASVLTISDNFNRQGTLCVQRFVLSKIDIVIILIVYIPVMPCTREARGFCRDADYQMTIKYRGAYTKPTWLPVTNRFYLARNKIADRSAMRTLEQASKPVGSGHSGYCFSI